MMSLRALAAAGYKFVVEIEVLKLAKGTMVVIKRSHYYKLESNVAW